MNRKKQLKKFKKFCKINNERRRIEYILAHPEKFPPTNMFRQPPSWFDDPHDDMWVSSAMYHDPDIF